MKIFGSISELVDLAFRLAGGKQVKLRAATQTTSGNLVTVNVPDVAATGDTQSMVLNAATQTLSNKTLSSPTVSGGTINNSVIGGSTPAAGTFTDIVGSTLDINTSAELQTLTIPSFSTAGILHNNSSGAVSSSLIVNADVDAAAAIAFSKLATLASGNILVGSSTGVPTSRAVTGDVTIDDLGATTIGASKVLNSMLAGNIDRSKLSSGTNYRILANNASGVMSENAALTANEAVATDANGQLVSVTGVSATELGYLSNVTSDVQTQLNSKQASDATLSTIAALTPTTDQYIYFSGADTATTGTITSFGRGLIDDADAATARSTLGLGSMATQAASSVAITGGTVRGVSLDRLAVESDNAAIASGTLVPSKGLMIITAGDNTLNTLNPSVGFNLVNGAVLTVINNEGADVTVTNAGNIQTGTGSDFTLKQGAASSFIWSTTLSKWVLSGGAGGAGGLATTYVTAGGITAVNNTHYLTNLSASGQTITLPSGTDGAVIRFSDAGEVWNVYPLTIAPATGQRINNLATNETLVCDVKGGWVELSFNSTYGGWALMSLASTTGTSGSGSGEINAISNPSAASDTTGWTNASRVTSGSPLDPVVSTALSIANAAGAESSTSGGRFNIASLPSGLRSRKLKVSFYFSTPATDVYRVSVYAGTTRLALSSDSAGATTLPANVTGGYFEAYFDSTTATAYSLNVTRTSGSTGACVITQVIVGPGINAQGAAVSEWISYSPSITNVTVGSGTVAASYMRVGSNIKVKVRFTYGAGSAVSGVPIIPLPSGLTVNSSVLTTTNGPAVGYASLNDASINTYPGTVLYLTSNVFHVYAYDDAASGVVLLSPSASVPFTWASGDGFNAEFEAPIAEWAGSGTVNLGPGAQVEYAWNSDTTNANTTASGFSYGPQGVVFGSYTGGITKTVRFQTPIQPGDKVWIEVNEDQSGRQQWVTAPSILILGRTGASDNIGMWLGANVNSTDVNVFFGAGGRTGSGAAWSGITDRRWRVVKATPSAPVGFGKSNSNEFGLVAPRRGQQPLTVTSSASGWSTTRAVGIYYQDQDGNHRLKLNVMGIFTGKTYTSDTITVSGVTFKNVSNFFQSCSGNTFGTSPGFVTQCYASPNTSTITLATSSSGGLQTGLCISGDVELESRPTWA